MKKAENKIGKTLLINTSMSEQVLNKILEQYGVEVYYNIYGYKEMAFKGEDETTYMDTFFKVMEYLYSKDIIVTIHDILVQTQNKVFNHIEIDYVKFTNGYHTKYSNIYILERE